MTTDEKLEDVALRHVLFEQYQAEHRDAYLAAAHYKQRGVETAAIKITQAAASLELGFLDHGRELIAGLEEGSLLPENQSRLRLYLARDAFRRRDWPLLETQLSLLGDYDLPTPAMANYRAYLSAELARQYGDLDTLVAQVESIDDEFPLKQYGLFNVAVAYADREDDHQALRFLARLTTAKPANYTDLMMIERARVASAELYAKANEPKMARSALAKVSVNHQYGPSALAQIARMDMANGRYDNAARLWQYLIQEYPWHRAATHAVSGLGFAMQETRGEEAAFAIYSDGLKNIHLQQTRLANIRERLQHQLENPESLLAAEDDLLLELSAAFGHDDWLTWFASADVRNLANRWQGLDQAFRKLQTDQEKLVTLLEIDHEQQSRIANANVAITTGGLDQQLAMLTNNLMEQKASLIEKEIAFSDDLSAFSNQEERALLREFDRLKTRAMGHDRHQQRIERLQGLVRFQVFSRLPKTRQNMIENLDQQLLIANRASNRMARINEAARLQPESVSTRIDNLALRHRALLQDTELALVNARSDLLASLDEYIGVDQELLNAQANGLQYDITRLVDRRVAAGENP